jgi:glycosyltransferase involved in cell wall biosynthesis
MNTIYVSIIVPVYNTAALLPRCIESLLSQTLKGIEIILINDASTDNSLDIMYTYKNQYPEIIHLIDSKINQRQGGARNIGIEAAKGQYIGFVDSDDWVDQEMYNLLYNKAIVENSDICYCYRQQVSEKNKISKDTAPYFLPEGIITEENRRKMLVHHITCVPKYIYKRDILITHNIRFPAHVRYEDMIIDPLILLYANNISAVKKILYNYFIRSGSTMTTINEKKYQDKIKVCKLIIEEYKQRGYYEEYKDEINYLYFRKGYIHATLNYLINTTTPRKKIVKQIRDQMLCIDKNYRKNQYYHGNFYFCVLDYIISYHTVFILKLVKIMFRITKYNV